MPFNKLKSIAYLLRHCLQIATISRCVFICTRTLLNAMSHEWWHLSAHRHDSRISFGVFLLPSLKVSAQNRRKRYQNVNNLISQNTCFMLSVCLEVLVAKSTCVTEITLFYRNLFPSAENLNWKRLIKAMCSRFLSFCAEILCCRYSEDKFWKFSQNIKGVYPDLGRLKSCSTFGSENRKTYKEFTVKVINTPSGSFNS